MNHTASWHVGPLDLASDSHAAELATLIAMVVTHMPRFVHPIGARSN